MNIAEFFSEQLHLLLDKREDEDLFVFVQETVLVHVEEFNELGCRLQPKQIINLTDFLIQIITMSWFFWKTRLMLVSLRMPSFLKSSFLIENQISLHFFAPPN